MICTEHLSMTVPLRHLLAHAHTLTPMTHLKIGAELLVRLCLTLSRCWELNSFQGYQQHFPTTRRRHIILGHLMFLSASKPLEPCQSTVCMTVTCHKVSLCPSCTQELRLQALALQAQAKLSIVSFAGGVWTAVQSLGGSPRLGGPHED